MVALRIQATGASCAAPFWLSALCAAVMPTSIGYQDLAAFLAQQPEVSQRGRDHMIASPFGTIEAATFSYSRPIGTAMPEPLGFQTVNFDPRSLDVKAWSIDRPLTATPAKRVAYPTVNRQHKGDRLPPANTAPGSGGTESVPQLQPIDAPSAAQPAPQPVSPPAPIVAPRPKNAEQQDVAPVVSRSEAADSVAVDAAPTAQGPARPQNNEAAPVAQMRSTSLVESDAAHGSDDDDDIALADKPPEIPAAGETDAAPASFASMSFLDDDPAERSAQIYFGGGALGSAKGLQQWAPGAAPVLVPPSVDSGIKLSALEGAPEDAAAAAAGGETVAGKGETDLLKSPALRLGLEGKPRAKAEKCLADAVYFEARGEPLKGQQAVAQVVMNRVFSGYYPHDVCGVVYQNASRHLACQFTFACEGKDLDHIDEPDMWEQAKRIAKDMLSGQIWLADIGHATHYHAYWVHPSWVNEMKKLYHLGVHTFYRPRAWGDGDDAPAWGPAPEASKADGDGGKPEAAAKTPDAAAKGPEANAAPPKPAAAKDEPTAKL
jgi:hypothetical protein